MSAAPATILDTPPADSVTGQDAGHSVSSTLGMTTVFMNGSKTIALAWRQPPTRAA
jgi:hypothetical protein